MKSQRGADEANSPLGQWVHDNLHVPGNRKKFDFWARDLDLDNFCKETTLERLFESKEPEQLLKPSQWDGLARDARKVDALIKAGELAPESAVWVAWFDEDDELVTELRQMRADGTLGDRVYPWSVHIWAFDAFLSCRGPLPSLEEVATSMVEGDRRWSPILGICVGPRCERQATQMVEGHEVCGLHAWRLRNDRSWL